MERDADEGKVNRMSKLLWGRKTSAHADGDHLETVLQTSGDHRPVVALATNGPQGDAFGRLRTSNPVTLFDSKQAFDNQPLFWDDVEVSGGSTTSTHSADRASSILGVGATTAGLRVRQTFQSINYQPGKSQLVLLTGVLNASGGGAGITRRIGFFDETNGLFFEDAEGTYNVVCRSHVTGSPVDLSVAQADWNLDTMDGEGPSGVTIDFSKAQIFVIDFEWLGTGRVRFALNIDGETFYVHEFKNANNLTSVYMSQASLPIRYEIDNDGTGAASTLEAICTTVISEGGQEKSGALRYTSTRTQVSPGFINANVVGTVYAVVGIKLKAAYIGTNIVLEKISAMNVTTDDYEWLVVLNPTIAGVAPTFADLANSAVQVAKGNAANPSTSTVTGGTILDGGLVKSSAQSGSISVESGLALKIGAAIDATVDELWLCIRPLTANADIDGALTWREEF
jgi:hypothetical protein